MELERLVAAPTRSLSNQQRRDQKSQRLVMVRRWWSSGLEVDAIHRMCLVHFKVSGAAAKRLLHAVADQLDDEADAYEQIPAHHVRHRHRARFEDLYRVCLDNGSLAAAERCLRALAEIDGVFRPRHEEDNTRPVVPVHQQGARTLSNEDLARLLEEGGEVVIDVPFSSDEEAAE